MHVYYIESDISRRKNSRLTFCGTNLKGSLNKFYFHSVLAICRFSSSFIMK